MTALGNKKNLKMGCTLLMCFFSLFSVSTAALAWFFSNNPVQGRDKVRSKVEDLHTSFFVYKYDKNNHGTDLDESTEDETDKLDIKNFKLNTYDTIFVSQNRYTPALIRIHISGTDLPEASAINPQNVSVKINRDLTFVDEDVEEQGKDISFYKCISSVAHFLLTTNNNYSSYTSGDLDTISDITTFFSDEIALFRASESSATTFFSDQTTKEDYITLTTQYTSTTTIDNVRHLNLFLFVDYDLTLIEKFTTVVGEQLAADFLSQIDTLLVNDLTSINVSFNE